MKDVQGETVDLGYCTFILPVKNINKMFVGGDGWIVGIESDKFKLQAIRPVKADPGVFEQYFLGDREGILNDSEKTLTRLKEMNINSSSEKPMLSLFQDYRWKQFVLKTKPKSFIDLFFSSPSELELYAVKMITGGNIYGQRGIGLLETSSTMSIIYLGCSDIHGKVTAETWSANGKITQAIIVSSESYELSEMVIRHVLSSYKYTLSELPSEEETKKITVVSAKLNEKYGEK
ncbi:MAG TPA: hypothetical protein DET40_19325 [Lentisphaeria bacterium]|nr:MAG: hypothetical protein A2X45_18155 [Lentisphaerae bacterium GWF2_50_93]HCE45699.1 hypothetical protein [Lentisphaeria bacterium]